MAAHAVFIPSDTTTQAFTIDLHSCAIQKGSWEVENVQSVPALAVGQSCIPQRGDGAVFLEHRLEGEDSR
jgi:hypothetical protein